MELPAGFVPLRRNGWQIAVREDLLDFLQGAGSADPRELAASGERRYRGRGRPVRIPLPDESDGVLRQFLSGGALRWFRGGLFLGSPRPFRELLATERARHAGVRVPMVVAAYVRRRFGLFHEGWILTREIPNARDLPDLLVDGLDAAPLLRAVGRETRRLHDAGVWHADLHVKNILVDADGVWLLDFDRARVSDDVSRAHRRQNLLRFDRSVVKLEHAGISVPISARLRYFRGYYDGRPPSEEREKLVTECRKSLRRHRLWWTLSGRSRRS